MNISKNLLSVIMSSALLLGITACEKDGPAENFGEEIDEVVNDAGRAVEDACEEAKDAIDASNTNC